MAIRGYFVISDISGYTEYLTRSELDHANEFAQEQLQWMSGLFANVTKVIDQDVAERKVLLP